MSICLVNPNQKMVSFFLTRICEIMSTYLNLNTLEIEFITFKRGVHGKGENMISKHDIPLNNRHNAERVMKFPPVSREKN